MAGMTGAEHRHTEHEDVNVQLYAYLLTNANANIARQVARAVGDPIGGDDELEPASLLPVDCYWIDWTHPEVLTIYVVSCARLIRHEVAKDGHRLSTVVPLSRVRRVAEEHTGAAVSCAIELDADQARFNLEGAIAIGENGIQQQALSGTLINSGWLLGVNGPDSEALELFATGLRRAMSDWIDE